MKTIDCTVKSFLTSEQRPSQRKFGILSLFLWHLIQGEESYRDERLALVWETWISLFRRGYFIESPSLTSAIGSMNALTRGDVNDPLTEKKAVMALAHHFIAGELSPEFASELDFFRFPQMNPNSPAGEVTTVFGYVIPAGAVHHTEASAFVGYMASAEAQTMLMARVGEDPTNAGWVPLHREVDRTLLSEAARMGAAAKLGFTLTSLLAYSLVSN